MVYVDALIDYGWRLGPSCHLLADSEDELHEFAARIGMKHSWFQPKSTPHYDLTRGRRERAVALGAKEIGRKEMIDIIRRNRQKGKPCT